MRAQAETRPPRLNGDEEREPGPDQGRDVQFHLCPGQNEPTQALQDLGNSQPEDDREEDREIVKGVHGIELRILGSMITLLAAIVGQFVLPFRSGWFEIYFRLYRSVGRPTAAR